MWFSCLCGQTTRRNDMNDGAEMYTPADFAKKFPTYYNAILKILQNE